MKFTTRCTGETGWRYAINRVGPRDILASRPYYAGIPGPPLIARRPQCHAPGNPRQSGWRGIDMLISRRVSSPDIRIAANTAPASRSSRWKSEFPGRAGCGQLRPFWQLLNYCTGKDASPHHQHGHHPPGYGPNGNIAKTLRFYRCARPVSLGAHLALGRSHLPGGLPGGCAGEFAGVLPGGPQGSHRGPKLRTKPRLESTGGRGRGHGGRPFDTEYLAPGGQSAAIATRSRDSAPRRAAPRSVLPPSAQLPPNLYETRPRPRDSRLLRCPCFAPHAFAVVLARSASCVFGCQVSPESTTVLDYAWYSKITGGFRILSQGLRGIRESETAYGASRILGRAEKGAPLLGASTSPEGIR